MGPLVAILFIFSIVAQRNFNNEQRQRQIQIQGESDADANSTLQQPQRLVAAQPTQAPMPPPPIAAAATETSLGLPPGWEEHFDSEQQNTFYVDTVRGVSQWEKPAFAQSMTT